MAIWITDDTMILEIGGSIVATARFRQQHSAADGRGVGLGRGLLYQ